CLFSLFVCSLCLALFVCSLLFVLSVCPSVCSSVCFAVCSFSCSRSRTRFREIIASAIKTPATTDNASTHCAALFLNRMSSPTVYALFENSTIATPYTNPAYAGPPGLCPRNRYHRIDQPDRRKVVSTAIVIMTASHRRNP